MERLTAFSVANGFSAYWFCDEYQACLEHHDGVLFIGEYDDGISLYLNSSNRQYKKEFIRLFTTAFSLRESRQR
jgi:hypothetical protein